MTNQRMEERRIPNGPAAAALLAGGIGSAFYGLIVLFSEVSESFGASLNWYNPVGPLSGKTTLGIIGFFVTWAVLHFMWKDKEVNFRSIATASFVLLAIGLLGTFPPVWRLFTGGG
jgi:hypothetical protein